MAREFVGTYSRYPDRTGERRAEGGRRLGDGPRESRSGAPLVSIVTVCFNAAATIEQSFRSVREQTYSNIEYVVVDGASTDGTVDLLKSHGNMIDYFVSEPDEGLYFAMNKGLSLAQGAHVLFLNADDWYQPDCVETLVRALQESGADFVSALANYVNEDGSFLRIQPESPFDAGVAFRMPLRHETMLIPAWLYDEMGPYDTSYRINADRAYTARLHDRGYRHHPVRRPLLNFRISGVSSVNLEGLFAERERMLRERFPGLTPAALRDLCDLERIIPARLLQIARSYRMPHLRAACLAYALDREAQGHKAWQDIDVDAFSPVIRPRPITSKPAAERRRALESRPRPKVSVILPVYNGEGTLATCLDSLLAQSMGDFEVICVNDCSPDDSQAVIDAYAARDERIRSRKNEVNVGHGASRNRGISKARGEWIFHVDPDDAVPPNALQSLLGAAETHGSDIVRGAFIHEQMMGGKAGKPTRKGLPEGSAPEVCLTLAGRPDLLHSTEGHWACLYRADFAKRVFYPEDLKMGQDSIFITQAYCAARAITLIPDVIYHYRANPNSAMNVFNFRKYIDEIEWRHRSWKTLAAAGMKDLGAHLLCNYWNPPSLETFDASFPAAQKQVFFRKLALAFAEAGNSDLSKTKNPRLKKFFSEKLGHFAAAPLPVPQGARQPLPFEQRLRIAVISTFDGGGAGGAALRSVEGLRRTGHDAKLYCIFKRSDKDYVWQLPVEQAFHADSFSDGELHKVWRRQAAITGAEQPRLVARELMSKPGSMLDPDVLRAVIADADIAHLHWVAGALDYDLLPRIAGDTPVVWTLHDMQPFTGSCHYSEGCEGYRHDCANCPLVSGATSLPQWAQKKKRRACEALPSLSVISPSDWLAAEARTSGIFGGRSVETIPNIFPAEAFHPVAKVLARQRLNLPLDRKLIVFGAESLSNRRKGGDLLKQSLDHLHAMGRAGNVEGIFFGSGELETAIPIHNMGFVRDPARLSLIYAAADAFAFPSREDNAPQTVMEAMLSGTPVVSFPVGYVPDLVTHRDTGYLADYADAKDFARGLDWALSRAGTAAAVTSGIRSHLAAAQHNDPGRAIDRHLELYRRMLAERAAASGDVREGAA